MNDSWLGGHDNFAAGRSSAVVRFLAGEAEIRQLLALSTGLPTKGNVELVAQAITPGDSRRSGRGPPGVRAVPRLAVQRSGRIAVWSSRTGVSSMFRDVDLFHVIRNRRGIPTKPEDDDTMRITFLRVDSPTGRTCPTLYGTDRATFLVQGKKILDGEVRARFKVGAGEDVVEVPARLLREIADEIAFPVSGGQGKTITLVRAIPEDAASPSVSATSRCSFIVVGTRVTDPEALAAMDIPDDETAVEVPHDLIRGISADAA